MSSLLYLFCLNLRAKYSIHGHHRIHIYPKNSSRGTIYLTIVIKEVGIKYGQDITPILETMGNCTKFSQHIDQINRHRSVLL